MLPPFTLPSAHSAERRRAAEPRHRTFASEHPPPTRCFQRAKSVLPASRCSLQYSARVAFASQPSDLVRMRVRNSYSGRSLPSIPLRVRAIGTPRPSTGSTGTPNSYTAHAHARLATGPNCCRTMLLAPPDVWCVHRRSQRAEAPVDGDAGSCPQGGGAALVPRPRGPAIPGWREGEGLGLQTNAP